jgi:hypothetical protein
MYSSPDRIHGSRLEVDQDGPGNELPSGSLIVVDADALQLRIRARFSNAELKLTKFNLGTYVCMLAGSFA